MSYRVQDVIDFLHHEIIMFSFITGARCDKENTMWRLDVTVQGRTRTGYDTHRLGHSQGRTLTG